MKFTRVSDLYKFNPKVDIYAAVKPMLAERRKLSTANVSTGENYAFIRAYSNVYGFAKVILATRDFSIHQFTSDVEEIARIKNPESKARMIQRLLENNMDGLWSYTMINLQQSTVPLIAKSVPCTTDQAEEFFTESVAKLFDREAIQNSIQRTQEAIQSGVDETDDKNDITDLENEDSDDEELTEEGAPKGERHRISTIFDSLYGYKTVTDGGKVTNLPNWIKGAIVKYIKTTLVRNAREKNKSTSLDTFGPNVDENFAESNKSLIDERAQSAYDNIEDSAYSQEEQALVASGLKKVVEIRQLANNFKQKLQRHTKELDTLDQDQKQNLSLTQSLMGQLVKIADQMVEAKNTGNDKELNILSDSANTKIRLLMNIGNEASKKLNKQQNREGYRQKFLAEWVRSNKPIQQQNKERALSGEEPLPYTKWQGRRDPPTPDELAQFGFTPEDLQMSAIGEQAARKREERRLKENKPNMLNILKSQQDAYKHMDEEREALLPHMYNSWDYPNLNTVDKEERKRLQSRPSKPLLSPLGYLYNGIGHPERAQKLFDQNADLSTEDKNRLWSHLLLSSALASNEKRLYDTRNGISSKVGNDLAIQRFVEHVKNSPIYAIDPQYFQQRLSEFVIQKENKLEPADSRWRTLLSQLDVYTRAAAYEQARYKISPNKHWSQLTKEEKDQMAKDVWDRFYKDKFREFRTVKDTDIKAQPIFPLSSKTDPIEYLYRIREEIEKISQGQSKWVSVSYSGQDSLKHKGHQGTQEGKQERKKFTTQNAVDPDNRYNWFETGLWNENGPTFTEETTEEAPIQNSPIETDLSNIIPNDQHSKLHAYQLNELVRIAQTYDDNELYEEANAIDHIIESKLKFANPSFKVRFVASDDQTRSKGLMRSTPLDEDEVAVFVFDKPGRYAFWNKNVNFPLSLAFLDSDGTVVDFADMNADSIKQVEPSTNAQFVIEAKHNQFNKLGVNVGDKFELSKTQVRILRTSLKNKDGRR